MRGAGGLVGAASVALGTAHAAAGAIDVSAGGGTAVPVDRAGTIEYATVGLSTFVADRHALGLRVAIAPTGVAETAAAPATLAWSPGVDYRASLTEDGRLVPFFTAGLGFVLADRSSQGRSNLAALAGQVGFGFEAGFALRSGARLVVAPSLGLAPGAFFGGGPFSVAAPIADLRVGARTGPDTE